MVSALVRAGAETTIRNWEGETPLSAAISRMVKKEVKDILEAAAKPPPQIDSDFALNRNSSGRLWYAGTGTTSDAATTTEKGNGSLNATAILNGQVVSTKMEPPTDV